MEATKDRERKENKMNLENYLQFFDSQKQFNLTLNLLNEIIAMHGYKRIFKVPKKVLIDAVDAIDLMDPARSTLEQHTSLPEIAKLEDVIEDLDSLSWQECCVTSIQTLNSHSASAKTSPRKKEKVRKPKKTLKSVHNKCSGDGVNGGASASASSKVTVKHMPAKLTAKRKRQVSEEGGGVHAPSQLSGYSVLV